MFNRLKRRRSSFDKSPHVLKTLHQQSVSSYNVTTINKKEGFLDKLSRNNKFQTRYFSLNGHYLLYYADIKYREKKPSGFIDLNNYSKVYLTNSVTSTSKGIDNIEDNVYIKILGGYGENMMKSRQGGDVDDLSSNNNDGGQIQDCIILRASTSFEAAEWERFLKNILLNSFEENNNNNNNNTNNNNNYIRDNTQYAPLHIEVQRISDNKIVETFGMPLIPPFHLKTVFPLEISTMKANKYNNSNVNHQLIISFVNVKKDDQKCLVCKTMFPPSPTFHAMVEKEEDEDAEENDNNNNNNDDDEYQNNIAVNRNVGEIVTPLIVNNAGIIINGNNKMQRINRNVNIAWHRQEMQKSSSYNSTTISNNNNINDNNNRNMTPSSILCIFRFFQKMFFFLFDMLCIITIPFLYINLYLNMLYVDDQYDISSTILMFYYNGSVDMNSNSTRNNGINSSKIMMDDPRMLMYIVIYFGIVQLWFLRLINYFQKSPMRYKYTFFMLMTFISTIFYLSVNNQLNFYLHNKNISSTKLSDANSNKLAYCMDLYNQSHCLQIPSVLTQNRIYDNFVIRNIQKQSFRTVGWFDQNIYLKITNIYTIKNIKDFLILNVYETFLSLPYIIRLKEFSYFLYLYIHNVVLLNVDSTKIFMYTKHGNNSNDGNGPMALVTTAAPDTYLVWFIITSWLIFAVLNLFYYKNVKFYKYTITNIDVVSSSLILLRNENEIHEDNGRIKRKSETKANTEIQSYEKPLIKEFLKITNQWAKSFNIQHQNHMISSEYHEDFMAVKFLRARQFDMDKAVTLFQQCHRWRMEHKTNTLATDFLPPDKILQYACPIGLYRLLKDRRDRIAFHLRDKKGHLCLFYRPGLPHWKKVFKCINNSETFAIKCVTWILAIAQKDCLEHYRQTGTPPYCTLIFDVGKFSMAKQVPIISALRMGRTLLKGINLGYPETLYKVVFIQASWVFVKFFDLFKPFIPPHLLQKIHIITDKKAALNYLNKAYVPTFFGGTMEDDKDDAYPSAVRDECPMKCGPGKTYWNKYFEDKGWKFSCI